MVKIIYLKIVLADRNRSTIKHTLIIKSAGVVYSVFPSYPLIYVKSITKYVQLHLLCHRLQLTTSSQRQTKFKMNRFSHHGIIYCFQMITCTYRYM